MHQGPATTDGGRVRSKRRVITDPAWPASWPLARVKSCNESRKHAKHSSNPANDFESDQAQISGLSFGVRVGIVSAVNDVTHSLAAEQGDPEAVALPPPLVGDKWRRLVARVELSP
jgi:hypothetical protein